MVCGSPSNGLFVLVYPSQHDLFLNTVVYLVTNTVVHREVCCTIARTHVVVVATTAKIITSHTKGWMLCQTEMVAGKRSSPTNRYMLYVAPSFILQLVIDLSVVSFFGSCMKYSLKFNQQLETTRQLRSAIVFLCATVLGV